MDSDGDDTAPGGTTLHRQPTVLADSTLNPTGHDHTDPHLWFGDEFLSMLGHEVRTPVTVITGYLELLDELGDFDGLAPEHRATMLAAIRRSADRLIRLVDHLTILSRRAADPTPGGLGVAAPPHLVQPPT